MSGLGEFIKERRAMRGWTQSQLTDASGVSKSHLSQIEGGKILLPSAEIRRRLAEALGVRHIDLLIAAGELTPEEIGPSEIPRNPFPRDDPRHQAVELLIQEDPAFMEVVSSVLVFGGRQGMFGNSARRVGREAEQKPGE